MTPDGEQPAAGPDGPDRPDPERSDHRPDGLDLAREQARAAAGSTPRSRRRRGGREVDTRQRSGSDGDPRLGGFTGSHPGEHDPQLLDATVERLVEQHGWALQLRVRGVFARWPELVGPEVGAHSTPETFETGRLVVRTDSTAWATQLRLLAPTVVRRLNDELGAGTVTELDVQGPRGPSWKRGRRSARDGRGPRDTYG